MNVCRLSKMIIFILCMVLINTGFVFAQKETDSSPIQRKMDLLECLGVTGPSFNSSEYITRGELAELCTRIMAIQVEEQFDQKISYFIDVPYDHAALGYINVVVNRKIMSGYSDNTFKPNQEVSLVEFLTAMVKVLGYEQVAKIKGDYPMGYLVVANETGVSNGIKMPEESKVDQDTAIEILYNTLNAPLLKVTKYGSDARAEVDKDVTLLSEAFDVTKFRGIPVANEKTEIYGNSKAAKRQINFSDKRQNAIMAFDIGGTDVGNYLGYNIEMFVRNDKEDIPVILYYYLDNNTIEDVVANDILPDKTKLSALTYLKENDEKETKLNIAQNAAFIYNGGGLYEVQQADLIPDMGNVKLIDNDGDGKYDVIYITDYTNYVVDALNPADAKITLQYFVNGINILELDQNSDDYDLTMYKNGSKVGFEAVKPWDIVSLAESKDGKIRIAYISGECVTGNVDELGPDFLVINEQKYKWTNDFIEREENTLNIGIGGNFILDKNGFIAAFNKSADTGIKYAYMVMAKRLSYKNYKVQFYSMDGKLLVYPFAQKVRLYVDNVLQENQLYSPEVLLQNTNMISSGSFKHQMAAYKVNAENQVNELHLASS